MLDRPIALSKKIAKTSLLGQWLYFRMLPFTDDHGKTHGDVDDIVAEMLPKEKIQKKITENKIRLLLIELHNNELLLWADGEVTEFVDWKNHQTLKGRPANSLFPDYQEVTGKGGERLEKIEKELIPSTSLPLTSTSKERESEREKIHSNIQGLILSTDEYDKLLSDYSKAEVDDVLQAMENYKGLSKKYISAYKTASNWLKRSSKPAKGGIVIMEDPQKGKV